MTELVRLYVSQSQETDFTGGIDPLGVLYVHQHIFELVIDEFKTSDVVSRLRFDERCERKREARLR